MSSQPPTSPAPPDVPGDAGADRRLALCSLWLLLPVLVGLTLGDLLVGLVTPGRVDGVEADAFAPSEELGYVTRPDYADERTRHDGLGLRSEPVPADAPPREVRVLAVGHSNSYGAGGTAQELVWSYRLQEFLDEDQPRRRGPVRVLNASVPGYSTYQAARRGRMLLQALEPDLLLVFTDPGRQSLVAPRRTLDLEQVGGHWVPKDVVAGWPGPLAVLPATLHRVLLERSNLYERHRTDLANRDLGAIHAPRFVLTRAPLQDGTRERVDVTEVEVAALVAECRTAGVELRFVVTPVAEQQSEARWERFLQSAQDVGAPPAGTPRREPTEALLERLAALDAVAWDLWEVGERIGERPNDFTYARRGDDHWNPAGHTLIARALFARLRKDALLAELATRRAASPRTAAPTSDGGAGR